MSTLHASSVWPVCQSGALWDQPGSSETELAAILLAHTDASCVCAGRICCAPLRPWRDASSSISASSARAPGGTVDAPVIALLLERPSTPPGPDGDGDLGGGGGGGGGGGDDLARQEAARARRRRWRRRRRRRRWQEAAAQEEAVEAGRRRSGGGGGGGASVFSTCWRACSVHFDGKPGVLFVRVDGGEQEEKPSLLCARLATQHPRNDECDAEVIAAPRTRAVEASSSAAALKCGDSNLALAHGPFPEAMSATRSPSAKARAQSPQHETFAPGQSSATNVTAATIGDFMDENVPFVSRCLFHRAATCQRLLA